MIIQTNTIMNILKELEKETGLDLTQELEEIYIFCLIYEEESQNNGFLITNLEKLKPETYCVNLNGKKENVHSIFYSKRRKVYCLKYNNGKEQEIKKIKVTLDIEGVPIVELLKQFNII